jgi:hypothetical protein
MKSRQSTSETQALTSPQQVASRQASHVELPLLTTPPHAPPEPPELGGGAPPQPVEQLVLTQSMKAPSFVEPVEWAPSHEEKQASSVHESKQVTSATQSASAAHAASSAQHEPLTHASHVASPLVNPHAPAAPPERICAPGFGEIELNEMPFTAAAFAAAGEWTTASFGA